MAADMPEVARVANLRHEITTLRNRQDALAGQLRNVTARLKEAEAELADSVARLERDKEVVNA